MTVALFHTPRPQECGIAVLDDAGTIVEFEEKPRHPRTNWANSGIYVASPAVFDFFEARYPQDLGFDILPRLVGRMKGFPLKDYLLDIGNHDSYQQGQRDAPFLRLNARDDTTPATAARSATAQYESDPIVPAETVPQIHGNRTP